MPRRRFLVVLPLLWLGLCLLGFQHPGDEYALWVVGSAAGIWVTALVREFGSPAAALPLVAAGGLVMMAGAGWCLDRLRTPWKLWLPLAVVVAVLVVEFQLSRFPDLAQARQRHGSLTAFLVLGAQTGGYAATLACMVGAGEWRLARRGHPGGNRE